MAYVFAFWFPPRGHDGGMPTSAKRQSACTRTCLCASSTEARLGPIRVPGRSSSRSDVFLCIPNARPRSSHTGDAAALQTSPKYSSGGGGGGADPRFFKCHFLFWVGLSTPSAVWAPKGRFREAGSIGETAQSAPFSGCGCTRTSPNLFFTPKKHGPN